jgi:hypothetical protein
VSPSGGDASEAEVGLCARCASASVQRNRRGSSFWRCRAADRDPRLRRYPPLPVRACPAWRAGEPEQGPAPDPL